MKVCICCWSLSWIFLSFCCNDRCCIGPWGSVVFASSCRKLSAGWERSYGEVLGWIKARLSFTIVRATDLCLRGSHVRWRSGTDIDDGAGLLVVMPVSRTLKFLVDSFCHDYNDFAGLQMMMMIIDLQIRCDPFINCVSGRSIIKFMLTYNLLFQNI